MNPAIWAVYGGLAGWVLAMLFGHDSRFELFGFIFMGMLASVLGGWLSGQYIKGPPVDGFDIRRFLAAFIFSFFVLLLAALIL